MGSKANFSIFQVANKRNIRHEFLDLAKKGKPYERNWISSIVAQNNIIRTNYFKSKIDKTQQINKFRLCRDRDETINHIISEYSKLAQKDYNTRHDWVWKVIHWKLSEKSKFDHTNQWYMHNPESVEENKMHKILWDFEIQTDHLILARRPNRVIVNKKKRERENLLVPANHTVKLKESEKKDLVRELKKTMEQAVIQIVVRAPGRFPVDWYGDGKT